MIFRFHGGSKAFVACAILIGWCGISFGATAPDLRRPSPLPLPNSTPPPLGAPMRQVTWATLSNQEISYLGSRALEMNPRSWYHGETENFIIHYRNFSDALQIAREIEFDLWYVAKTLGAAKEQYARKSHVYMFQDDKEWREFVKQAHQRDWSNSFAVRYHLSLN